MVDRQRRGNCSELELLNLAKEHLQEFSLVGFTDTFAADFHRVISALGLPEPDSVPRELRTGQPVEPTELKASTLATLKDRLALDYQLCDWARTLPT